MVVRIYDTKTGILIEEFDTSNTGRIHFRNTILTLKKSPFTARIDVLLMMITSFFESFQEGLWHYLFVKNPTMLKSRLVLIIKQHLG